MRSEDRAFRGAPIVVISIDTLRSDRLPVYGYRGVSTPHIDALRRDAILFERAYSPCPMTLPAHLSIFTGLLPAEHGVRNNIGYRFDEGKFTTLAERLRANGYATGAAVSSYVLRSETGAADGFEFYEDAIPVAAEGASSEHQRSGMVTLERAAGWIERNRRRPFFFFFHIYEPHAPYDPPEPHRSRHRDPYDGEVARSDEIVGAFLDTLRRNGVYDDAIIVLLSDHGEGLWEHGEDQHGILLYRESLQVPLLVKLPGNRRGNTALSVPVGLADVHPTVLALAGIETSTRNLLGGSDAAPRPVYSETLYPRIHLGWSELRSLIDGRHHYIEGPRPELYDLGSDPRETRDLASTERRVAASMRARLADFPREIAALEPIDPEEARKLAALGYVGTAQNRAGPLPNPRDEIGQIAAIKHAFRLADQRRYDDAIPALRALLDRNPRLSDVSSKLAEALVESGRYEEAVETYQRAIERSERFSPDLALGLGFAHLKAGSADQAIAHAGLAVRTSPREAHELLARAATELRRFGEARRHAQAALEAGDRQPSTLLVLAQVQRAEGDLEGALRTIAEAEERGRALGVPHLYGIDYLRGDVLARLERVDEAIAAFRREIERSPQHLQSYANLAVVYAIQGRMRDAERVLGELVERNPHRGARDLAEKTRRALAG